MLYFEWYSFLYEKEELLQAAFDLQAHLITLPNNLFSQTLHWHANTSDSN